MLLLLSSSMDLTTTRELMIQLFLYETMQDVCGMGLPASWVRHVVTPTLCQSKYYTSSPPSCSYHPRTTGTRVSISDQLLNINFVMHRNCIHFEIIRSKKSPEKSRKSQNCSCRTQTKSPNSKYMRILQKRTY